MSTNRFHLNVHSYVYFKIHQNSSCSILHLVSFKGFCGCVLKISKEVKSTYRLITDNHCTYIHRSFSVVIVCILWMAFFSRELDLADHY